MPTLTVTQVPADACDAAHPVGVGGFPVGRVFLFPEDTMRDTLPTYLLLELRRRAEVERYADALIARAAVCAFASGAIVGALVAVAVMRGN